jgi:hypothetical protein
MITRRILSVTLPPAKVTVLWYKRFIAGLSGTPAYASVQIKAEEMDK